MTAREDRGVQVEARTLSGVRFTACTACGCHDHGSEVCGAEADNGLIAVTCTCFGPPTELVTLTDGGAE
ncbi:hypothetical protein ASF35_01910 [Aeromicrobium sp. Leaf291]|nr:hypothetical protein ASF35_01910 [Aeromicrobium sp. Leaf291]